jgi:hypothetical protein
MRMHGWTNIRNTQCTTRTKFTISHCMVYFPDSVKVYLRKAFTYMRCRKMTQHKITSDYGNLITNSNLQYHSMVKSHPATEIHVLDQITPINYQVITLHTVNANFNHDISAVD